MPTFANIQEEIRNILDIPDEELTDEQKTLVEDYLNELGQQEASKVDGFAQFILLEAARAKAMKDEARRLTSRAKTAENRIAYLKSRYLDIMSGNGLKKVQGDAYTLSVRESKAVVVPADLSGLDEIFLRRKEMVEADKAVIKEALANGQSIPGCELRTNYSLQIK